MSEKILFSYAATLTPNKDIIKKDGWYKVNLGGFNCFNEHNEFYLSTNFRELIQNPTSRLYEKLSKGYLEGECRHPEYKPGMTKMDYYLRNIAIDPDRVSHAIRDIEIVDSGKPAGKGFSGNAYIIRGWVKPIGKYKDYLTDRLETKDCNTSFSIRALSDCTTVNGITVKTIKSIITFDFVDEPGIAHANQWQTTNESFSSKLMESANFRDTRSFTVEEIESYEKSMSKDGISTESLSILKEINKEIKSRTNVVDNLAIF